MNGFFDAVQVWTEKQLTIRKAKNVAKKTKKKTVVSETLEWLDALLFAVVVVLLINQYLFQLFVIPSPSMKETLLEGDRVIVSKVSYGIETIVEGPKVFNARIPDRDDIITFYNPDYESRGKAFSLLSTILYMGTFSLVNIDTYEDGTMREKLLVKRAAAVGGDTIRFVNGNAQIKPSGTGKFIDESVFRSGNGYVTAPHRTINSKEYTSYNAVGILNGLVYGGVKENQLPNHLIVDYSKMDQTAFFTDQYGFNQMENYGRRLADPSDIEAKSNWAKSYCGIYVPEGYVLPLGDNRDNSSDGRYFGPVSSDKVNGMVISRFWPVSRISGLVNN